MRACIITMTVGKVAGSVSTRAWIIGVRARRDSMGSRNVGMGAWGALRLFPELTFPERRFPDFTVFPTSIIEM